MATRTKLWDLIKAAFNARPLGMFIPPNWIGIAAFSMLGLINPGLWLVGTGLELGYLFWLVNNPRFRRVIAGRAISQEQQAWQEKIARQIEGMSPDSLAKYKYLESRCLTIIEQQGQESSPVQNNLDTQADGLSRLLWIYLRLIQAQELLMRLDHGAEGERERLQERSKSLQVQLKDLRIADDLRKSLTSQLDIVNQRVAKREEATAKGAFVAAEIERIEEQVELIREQAMLASDPRSVSQRIDDVAATLGGTSDWIREQQQVFGQVEDLIGAPPPPLLQAKPRPRQSI